MNILAIEWREHIKFPPFSSNSKNMVVKLNKIRKSTNTKFDNTKIDNTKFNNTKFNNTKFDKYENRQYENRQSFINFPVLTLINKLFLCVYNCSYTSLIH